MKLSKAQKETLITTYNTKGQVFRCVSDYKPAQKLLELGLFAVSFPGEFSTTYRITSAGRVRAGLLLNKAEIAGK